MSVIDIVGRHPSCKIKSVDITILQIEHAVVDERNFDALGSGRHVESCCQLLSINDRQEILHCSHCASWYIESECPTVVTAWCIEANSIAAQSERSGLNDAVNPIIWGSRGRIGR